MFGSPLNTALIKTTSYKVVVPFYAYAATSFLIACVLLLISTIDFTGHYFNPHILAVVHTMALGWGTMVIFGASHQLVPVLIEGKLYSEPIGYVTFALAALGIPLLVLGFYLFSLGWLVQLGGTLVVLAVLTYLVNIFMSIAESKKRNAHSLFIASSIFWLFLTVLLGLALIFNFTTKVFPNSSLHYLPLHAHLGIVGWFLLLVFGVASRLIPMFLISKYTNPRLLYFICFLVNLALVIYFASFFAFNAPIFTFIPIGIILFAVVLFIYFCFKAREKRLRRKVDEQTGLSILAVVMLLLPIVFLIALVTALLLFSDAQMSIVLTYGFLIFFGWLSAIILGMTFKTLTFIVWNKVYKHRSSIGRTPSPKDLFSHKIFNVMGVIYLSGVLLFAVGILMAQPLVLKIGAVAMLATAILYNWNVIKIIQHKPIMYERSNK